MIVYDWKITSLTKKTINETDDVVIGVTWEKTGYDDDGYKGSFKIFTSFKTDQVGINTSFIQYQNLTKKDIINWIESVTDQNQVNSKILESIQKHRDNEVQVNIGNFPWEV